MTQIVEIRLYLIDSKILIHGFNKQWQPKLLIASFFIPLIMEEEKMTGNISRLLIGFTAYNALKSN
jgi:hypothetical protein